MGTEGRREGENKSKANDEVGGTYAPLSMESTDGMTLFCCARMTNS